RASTTSPTCRRTPAPTARHRAGRCQPGAARVEAGRSGSGLAGSDGPWRGGRLGGRRVTFAVGPGRGSRRVPVAVAGGRQAVALCGDRPVGVVAVVVGLPDRVVGAARRPVDVTPDRP